jgi:uncharacterized protein with ParB-like and HNH nuclease domain
MGNLKPLSVAEILERNFFVPSYQRGYRWTDQQVEDLLNDFWDFARNTEKSEKEFYCLQPVVVKKCKAEDIAKYNLKSNFDNNTWYEVIDGQQRLTTIRILLSYLVKNYLKGDSLKSEYGKAEFNIYYERAPELSSFFGNITPQLTPIDSFYISNAYGTITEWIENAIASGFQKRVIQEKLLNILVKDMEHWDHDGVVQIIWYEIENDDPIQTFIRLNMGKIPLTSAELIKALFLQRRNFNDTEYLTKQIQIATKWDEIEYALQDDKFWHFLNEADNDMPARIEFLFNMMLEIDLASCENIEKYIGSDKYKTFRYFYLKFKNAKNPDQEYVIKLWDGILKFYRCLDEWYRNDIWYHYIGYLLACEGSILEIYNKYKDTKKSNFTEKLESLIKDSIKDISVHREQVINDDGTPIKDAEGRIEYEYQFDNLSYDRSPDNVRKVLLLFNIVHIVKHCGNNDAFIKFSFNQFKTEKWDIEHIDSFTENKIKEKETQKQFLLEASADLDEVPDDLRERIKSFEISGDANLFNSLYEEIVKLADESYTETDKDAKNNIGNLALLNARINRSYGNAIFPTKRRVIIENDREGKFIPICTRNVFLKYYNQEKIKAKKWDFEDMKKYQNKIGETLERFWTFRGDNKHG